ncbi:IS66 family transposase [Saccharopolyspora sp. ASAGF58]|uniref:IS66 family transposase n=1 Tax=Saccharopolyspora sp. ASAGF58 TaxID=2719023 RepID=UPI00143FD3C4|nr:IS66 family transposase [Saccharopolyspora sp. ASAGF58]QIZ37967.1 IS66 family transposase [Saccharopolyspora sp. ASAGF58]
MPVPEAMTRDELIELVGEQGARIAALGEQIAVRDRQITVMATQMAELAEVNETLGERLAKLEHVLSRNSKNSSSPPSKDDGPGRTPPPAKAKRGGASKRRGKQPGTPGANLAWTDSPGDHKDRFLRGVCECGTDLAGARDLGVVDRYQQHEIPPVSVKITQYDQHAVRCGCGRVHTAARPEGARPGPVGYGPNLQAFAVYLMVVHFIPVHRCVELLASLTGAAPSVGFVHGMLTRAAGVLTEVDTRIRTLITLAYAVCCDETPLRVGPRTPKPGKKKAEKYLLVACTELFTHYLLGDRDLATFKAFVIQDLAGSVIVHDRYQNYDSAELGELTHQLCCAHLGRDLDGAGEVYPGAHWPTQIADALRGLIHEANLARATGRDAIEQTIKNELIKRFRDGVRVGLSDTTSHGNRPGERKTRLLLEVLRDREPDVLRFAHDLKVPPTSNQAERDLRPAKVQQNISGRLTSEKRTKDRYRIRGYLSTASKHGRNMIEALREAIRGHPWMPPDPTPA